MPTVPKVSSTRRLALWLCVCALASSAHTAHDSPCAGLMASRRAEGAASRRAGTVHGGRGELRSPQGLGCSLEEGASALLERYEKLQLLYIPGAFSCEESVDQVVKVLAAFVGSQQGADDASALCASVQDTWNVENGNGGLLRSPQRLLSALAACAGAGHRGGDDSVIGGGRWYTSCVVQHNDAALNQLLRCLPCGGVPPFMLDDSRARARQAGAVRQPGGRAGRSKQKESHYSMANAPCAWVFIGQNVGKESEKVEAMRGRPEHTDAIAHSGTWHMQLSGAKEWHLRPNAAATWPNSSSLLAAQELVMQHGTAPPAESQGSIRRLHLTCGAGDLLLINTRLWFHATQIPSTHACAGARQGAGGLKRHVQSLPISIVQSLPISMSVARDFYLGEHAAGAAGAHVAAAGEEKRKAKFGQAPPSFAHPPGSGGARTNGDHAEDADVDMTDADVDMTNVHASWALADMEKGVEVMREHATLAVQDVMNRREFVCCDACCRPVASLDQALSMASNWQTRHQVVADLGSKSAGDGRGKPSPAASAKLSPAASEPGSISEQGRQSSRKRPAPLFSPAFGEGRSMARLNAKGSLPRLPPLAQLHALDAAGVGGGQGADRDDGGVFAEDDGGVCAEDGVVLCSHCAATLDGLSCRLLRSIPSWPVEGPEKHCALVRERQSALAQERLRAIVLARTRRLLHSLSRSVRVIDGVPVFKALGWDVSTRVS